MIEKNITKLFSPDSAAVSPNHDDVLNVVEFGCATGSSSIDPLSKIQSAAGSRRKVKTVMNDLPLNDWDTLQQTLGENMPDVDVEISRQSMYKDTVAEKGSVDIAYSCFAQHWLSGGVPCPLPVETGALWGNQLVGLPEYKSIHEQWSEKSRKDWERFLDLRAAEMRSGGQLVLHIQSANLDGTMPEGLAHACQVAKKQCLEEGIFTAEEASAMCVPEYCKNIVEILEPLQSKEGASKWNILECHQLPAWTLSSDIVDPDNADKPQHVRDQNTVNLAKSFMNASLERAFKEGDREDKLERFWDKVLEFASTESANIDANFGVTLLALERK